MEVKHNNFLKVLFTFIYMNKAFFIDKDGTIVNYKVLKDENNRDAILRDDYLFHKVIDGLKYIKQKGYKLIVISNQPWISKGIVNYNDIEYLFERLVVCFKEKGIDFDDYFFCPHQNSDQCECRKPKPGMIIEAAKKHGIDLSKSYIVGDSHKDILAGQKAGVKTIFVLTGELSKLPGEVEADYILNDLNDVKKII